MNNNTIIVAIAIAAVLICGAAAVVYMSGDATEYEYTVLVDSGNGNTHWEDTVGTGCIDAMSSAASSAGMDLSYSDGRIAVDGKSSVTIGNTTTSWRTYEWSDSVWKDVTSAMDRNYNTDCEFIAVGFYPEGIVPAETPDYRTSWTMWLGDSGNTGHQTAALKQEGKLNWTYSYMGSFVDCTALVVGPHVFFDSGGAWGSSEKPMVTCFNLDDGKKQWKFEYPVGAGYEVNTGVIYGGHYYLPATNENVYKIPLTGPGSGNSEVEVLKIDDPVNPDKVGERQEHGPATMIYDSGMIYFGTGNGYMYCIDADLNVAWKTPVTGSSYYYSPTIHDGKVYMPAYDGRIHVMDQVTGELLQSLEFDDGKGGKAGGHTGTPTFVDDVMYVAYSAGNRVAAADVTDSGLKVRFTSNEYACYRMVMLPVENDDFNGVYYFKQDTLVRMDRDGNTEVMMKTNGYVGSPLTLLNDEIIMAPNNYSGGYLYEIGLDGEILGMTKQPDAIKQYSMAPMVVVDNWIIWNDDRGVMVHEGHLPAPVG